jgi:hypothetical protein
VWKDTCQLIARSNQAWTTIGPKWDLPVEVPRTTTELKDIGTDTLRLTAWQYAHEHPGSDIEQVLSRAKKFEVAIADPEP